MARGGYRKPERPATVSGPGKFSRRTDGQPIRSTDLDTPGQKFGDRAMIEESQRAVPIRGAAGAAIPRRAQHSAGTGKKLPPFLFQMDSANPLEPVTTGLPLGPGAGPEALVASEPPEDEVEQVLFMLATEFQDEMAARHLAEYRNQRATIQKPAPVPSAPQLNSAPNAEPTEPAA